MGSRSSPPSCSPSCSVVIPAYQAERFLRQAIDSALAQTHPAREVIVVNDGSTDATHDIARGYGDEIVYVAQDNAGPAAARNAAISVARGEMVAFLDSDDWWAPTRLERCVEVLRERDDVGIVTTDAVLVDGDTPTRRRYYGDVTAYAFPPPDLQLQEIARRNFVFVSAVVRRSLLATIGPFDESLRGPEDYDVWTRMLLAGARVHLIREPLAFYRVRPDSLSANLPAQWAAHLRVLEKHLPELWRRGVRARAGLCFDVARSCAARRRYRASLRFLAMGARASDLPASTRARAVARGVVDLAIPPARRAAASQR